MLGHRQLSATLVYARVHDRTVAEDYYAAMAVIEERLEMHLKQPIEPSVAPTDTGAEESRPDNQHLLKLVNILDSKIVDDSQRAIVVELRSGLLALAAELNLPLLET